jgi:hypothetical protein
VLKNEKINGRQETGKGKPANPMEFLAAGSIINGGGSRFQFTVQIRPAAVLICWIPPATRFATLARSSLPPVAGKKIHVALPRTATDYPSQAKSGLALPA